jgi:hypothetical protein
MAKNNVWNSSWLQALLKGTRRGTIIRIKNQNNQHTTASKALAGIRLNEMQSVSTKRMTTKKHIKLGQQTLFSFFGTDIFGPYFPLRLNYFSLVTVFFIIDSFDKCGIFNLVKAKTTKTIRIKLLTLVDLCLLMFL